MRTALTFGCVAVATLLAACGDKPQALTAGQKKPDTASYQGQGGAFQAAGWTNGDKASWETQLKARSQGQNDYARVTGN